MVSHLNNAITVGTPTNTGGKVLTGSAGIKINGKDVAVVGDTATCTCGAKNCRGQGPIKQGGGRKIMLAGKSIAMKGDPVDTGCGNCFLLSSGDQVSLGTQTSSGINIGSGVNIGNGVNINMGSGVSFGGNASSVAGAQSNPSALAAQEAYDFTKKEWNEDLKKGLKEYLEGRHTQVCILTVDDAAKCALNLWDEKSKKGETLGKEVLDTLEDIHSKVDMGIGLVAAAKVSLALGGLGVTVKQFVDSKGVERIIISSLWNDSKMHYAVVNGLNIKKNHPYLISNPTIKQLGVLAENTIDGFKKGAVLSLIISAAINTDELIFNDDYHLVDWCGSMGSDLFKAMSVFALSSLAVSLSVAMGISVPILAGVLLWMGIEQLVDSIWDEFKVEDTIVTGLKNATS